MSTPEHVTEVQRKHAAGARPGSSGESLALPPTGCASLSATCPQLSFSFPSEKWTNFLGLSPFCGISGKSARLLLRLPQVTNCRAFGGILSLSH